MPSMLTRHSAIAAITILPLVGWAAYAAASHTLEQRTLKNVEIGVEHALPATLSLTASRGKGQQLMDITNDNNEILFVSVPEEWRRTEVRNVPLATITADDASLGFRRWHLPPKAGLGFTSAHAWKSITFHNPSGIALKLRVTTVDLERDTAEHDVYLVKDEPFEIH